MNTKSVMSCNLYVRNKFLVVVYREKIIVNKEIKKFLARRLALSNAFGLERVDTLIPVCTAKYTFIILLTQFVRGGNVCLLLIR